MERKPLSGFTCGTKIDFSKKLLTETKKMKQK